MLNQDNELNPRKLVQERISSEFENMILKSPNDEKKNVVLMISRTRSDSRFSITLLTELNLGFAMHFV